MSRFYRNWCFALTSTLIFSLVYIFNPTNAVLSGISIATAYVSLIYLTLALSIGPLNLIRNIHNPTSSYLRRDIGIWSGIFGLAHTLIGLQVHFQGQMELYFIFPYDEWRWMPLRYDFFGIANYSGLIASLLFFFLLTLSRNSKLKQLGMKAWKTRQQLTYILALTVLLHAIVYQVLENRALVYVGILLFLSAATATLQWKGYIKHRQSP